MALKCQYRSNRNSTFVVGDTAECGTIDTTGSYTNMNYVPALKFNGWNHTESQLGNTQFDFDIGAKYETDDGKLYALIYGHSIDLSIDGSAENPVTIYFGDGNSSTFTTHEEPYTYTYGSTGYWWLTISDASFGALLYDPLSVQIIKLYGNTDWYSNWWIGQITTAFQIDGFSYNIGKNIDYYVNEDSGIYTTITGLSTTGSIPKGVGIFSTSPDTLVSGAPSVYNALRRVRKFTVNIGDNSGSNSFGISSFVNLSAVVMTSFKQTVPPTLSSSTMWTGFPPSARIAVPTASVAVVS